MKLIKIFQIISLGIALLGFGLSYYVTSIYWADQPFLFAISNFLSYITVQSNILVIASLILMILNINSRKSKFIFFGTTVNVIITLIGYWAFLSYSSNYFGLGQIANILIHLVVPIIYTMNWFLNLKTPLSYKYAIYWMIYPCIYYLAFVLIKGLLTNWYPYYFVDLSQFSLLNTLPYVFSFAIFFLILSLIIVKVSQLKK